MKKILGKENRQEALTRMGLKAETNHVPKYVKKGAHVYKMVAGQLIPLTKLKK